MGTKSPNEYKRRKVSCIINIVSPLHVSANLVANLREVHYKGYIAKACEPKTYDRTFVHWFKNFCNMSFVMYLSEVGHKSY